MEFMMAFRYSRSAMTGAAIFTLAGVTVLPLAQANAAPVSPQGEGASSASQNAQGQQAQGGATQGQQAPQGGGASSASQSGQGQQQGQPGATQDQQGANANGQGQQQGAPASQSSSNSNSASQNNQSRQSQPSAPANQNSGFIAITSVDGFIDPQNTDNVLSVETTGIDNTHRVQYEPRVQELDEFGNIVNDDVSNGGGSSLGSDGSFGMYVSVDGTKINPSHKYQVHLTAYDQGDMTTSEGSYPVVVWNHTHIPVFPLLAAQ